jgi:hypothetical protein
MSREEQSKDGSFSENPQAFSYLTVGVDAHIDPAECTDFSRKSTANLRLPGGPMCTGKRQTHIRNDPSSRTAVTGIGPYKFSANPYCLANFKRKADLPQPFKGTCLQICCTVTGGAYQNSRRVTMCVRRD